MTRTATAVAQVPTLIGLAELVQDPGRAAELPGERMPAFLAQCAAVQSALAARQAALVGQDASRLGEVEPDNPGGWLTVEEANAISNLGVRWLYRHWRQVGGAKKFSRKRLRFHEETFRRWLQKRP
jgi:hypothetical protein